MPIQVGKLFALRHFASRLDTQTRLAINFLGIEKTWHQLRQDEHARRRARRNSLYNRERRAKRSMNRVITAGRSPSPPTIPSSLTPDSTSPPSQNQPNANASQFVPVTTHDTNRLPTIVVTNTRSVCNKVDLLNQFLDDSLPDIACITETWMTSSNKDVVLSQISNKYRAISDERCNESRAGGTLVLVKKSYSSKVQTILPTALCSSNVFFCDPAPLELSIVRAYPKRLPRGFSSCLIVCAYIPTWSTSSQQKAIAQLNQAISGPVSQCTVGNRPLIILAGDLNGANTNTICSSYELRQLNKAPTRNEAVLDIILSNSPSCYMCCNHPSIGRSDHQVVFASPKFSLYQLSCLPSHKVLYRSGKIIDTVAAIRTCDLDTKIVNKSAQEGMDIFYAELLAAENYCQPLKASKTRDDKPWMTPDLKKSIQQRQRLFYSGLHDEWKALANKIKGMIWARKREYNKRYKAGTLDSWREIKRVKSPASSIFHTPESVSTQSSFFSSVWKDIEHPDISKFITSSPTPPREPIFSVDAVLERLKQVNVGSAGPDQLSPRLIKSSRLEIAFAATQLFNQLINESVMPTQWKDANITPVGKMRNPTSPEDHRPIAITSSLCKVFERILASYIIRSTKDIWKTNKQFGFLPGRSTMDAIIQVIEDWSLAKDNKNAVFAIFFDFSKAFDLVDHVILLEKLQKLNFPPWLVSWLAAYLTGRRQRVKCGKLASEWTNIEAGVIQGSVLGPILFILFASDINTFIPAGVDLEKYADDILSYIIYRLSEGAGTLPQLIAEGVERWCAVNKMRLNATKCKCLHLAPAGAPVPTIPTLNGIPVELVTSYKYLGVQLNNELDWDAQWERLS